MRQTTILSAGLGAMLASMLTAMPAEAQNNRSWVAGNGTGTICTRAAPCLTFQAAHDATNPGGEINCVDAGDFTNSGLIVTIITKSITIDCGGTFGAMSSGNFNIDGNGIIVRLRNLTLQGVDGPNTGNVAIDFVNGAALYVEHCSIVSWRGTNGGFGAAILFTPPNGIAASLYVTDSILSR